MSVPTLDGRLPLDLGAVLTQRVRNHVNPLNGQYQVPAEPPHWEHAYARLTQPFHLDIGCGPGRFLIAMAQAQPDWNFLGVEIRSPLVERAQGWVEALRLDNLSFLFANINVTLPYLFAPGELARVSIQFPDPWFKNRHHKRRVVQPELVAALAHCLQPGGTVFLQSDVAIVATEMAARFAEQPDFTPPVSLAANPLGIPTEREVACQERGLPIYRYCLERR